MTFNYVPAPCNDDLSDPFYSAQQEAIIADLAVAAEVSRAKAHEEIKKAIAEGAPFTPAQVEMTTLAILLRSEAAVQSVWAARAARLYSQAGDDRLRDEISRLSERLYNLEHGR
jgi:hypothetical protein